MIIGSYDNIFDNKIRHLLFNICMNFQYEHFKLYIIMGISNMLLDIIFGYMNFIFILISTYITNNINIIYKQSSITVMMLSIYMALTKGNFHEMEG